MNKVSKVLSVSVATAIGAAVLAGSDSVSADTVPNKPVSQYVIKSGDTLNKIAQDYSTTAQEIANDNGIKDVNVIFAGDTITVGGQASDVSQAPAATPAPTQTAPVVSNPAPANVVQASPAQPVASGSVHDRFIAAGGTEALWENIVMPESGGNPNITSPNGYHGLGQTKQSWGYGSVEEQTQGMINYANSRYGSIGNAVAYRVANHSW